MTHTKLPTMIKSTSYDNTMAASTPFPVKNWLSCLQGTLRSSPAFLHQQYLPAPPSPGPLQTQPRGRLTAPPPPAPSCQPASRQGSLVALKLMGHSGL